MREVEYVEMSGSIPRKFSLFPRDLTPDGVFILGNHCGGSMKNVHQIYDRKDSFARKWGEENRPALVEPRTCPQPGPLILEPPRCILPACRWSEVMQTPPLPSESHAFASEQSPQRQGRTSSSPGGTDMRTSMSTPRRFHFRIPCSFTFSTLLFPLMLLSALPFAGCGRQEKNDASSRAAWEAAGGRGTGSDEEPQRQPMRFRTEVCIDKTGTGKEAFRMLVPTGWNFSRRDHMDPRQSRDAGNRLGACAESSCP